MTLEDLYADLIESGESKRIARRLTSDGKAVELYDDGSLTGAMGFAIKGSWFNPKPKNRERALRAGWLVLGDVEFYSRSELPNLVKAARWAADRDGLPGTMRDRYAKLTGVASKPGLSAGAPSPVSVNVMKPQWVVVRADARGKPTERVWEMHRMSPWSGHAVFHERGKYWLMRASRRDGVYDHRVNEFRSQRELLRWMAENPPRMV